MDLQTFRKQNSAYDDWSDQELADGLYQKFYSDRDRGTFDQEIGYNQAPPVVEQPPAEEEGLFSRAKGWIEDKFTPSFPSGAPQQMPMPGDMMKDPETGIIPDLGPEGEKLPGASTAPVTERGPSPLQQIPTQVPMSDALKSTIETWPNRIKRSVAAGLYAISDTALQGKNTLPEGSAKRQVVEKRKKNYLQYYEDAVKAVAEDAPIFQHQPYTKFVTEVATVTEDMMPAIGGGLAFGPLMGQQAMTLSLMGSQVFGPAYMEGINAGETPGQALFRGFYKSGVETLTEKIPVAKLFERGTPAVKRVLDMTVYEGAQEAASSILNDLYDKGTITPDMTMREALANAGYEFLIGMGAGGTLGTAAAGVHKLIEPGKREQAGKLLWDLVDSGQINAKVAEEIALNQMLPPQPEGTISPTGHKQGERVGPTAKAAPTKPATVKKPTQDQEDKAKILKALEVEEAEKGQAEHRGEIVDDAVFAEKVKESEAANKVEREYTGADVGPMEEAFKRAAETTADRAELKGLLSEEFDEQQIIPEGIEADEEGNVTLHHYSGTAGLSELDPAMHGTGIAGEESKLKKAQPKDWVDRTYFYMDAGHKKEPNLGKERYATSVPFEKLYPLDQDPEGFFDKTMIVSKYNPKQRIVDRVKAERLIKEAGYLGYWADNKQLGKSVAMFGKTKVTPRLNPEKLTYQLKLRGGYTVDPTTGAPKKEGFAVGIGKEETTPGIATPEQIAKYQAKYAKDLAQPDHYVGAWVYERKTFQDVSKVHTPDAAGLKAAILLGKKKEEIGIQDLSKEDPDEGYIELAKVGNIDEFVRNYFAGEAIDENVVTAANKNAPWDLAREVDEMIEPGLKSKDTVQFELDFAQQVENSSKGSKWPMKTMGPRQTKVLNGLMNGLKAMGLPDAATLTVRAYMNLGWNSLGAHRPISPVHGNHSVLALAGLGTPGVLRKFRLRASMMGTLAHEIGHQVDIGATPEGANFSYASTNSPMFAYHTYGFEVRTGPILDEVRSAYVNKVPGMRDIFEYPMYYTTDFKAGVALAQKMGTRGKADAMITKETFAQLFGFYYPFGRTPKGRALMLEHMPIGLEFMENLHEILQTSQTVDQRDARVREAFQTFTPGRGAGAAELREPGQSGPEAGQAGPDPRLLSPGAGDQSRTVGASIRSLRGPTPTETARAVKRAEAISTIPLLEGTGQIPVKGTGPYDKVVGGDVGRAMNAWVRKNGAPIKVGDYRPATIESVAQSLYLEVGYQLERDDSAIGWYESTLERAMNTLAQIHPELKTSADAATVFNLALAVTSNGTRVTKNFELAEQAYRGWKGSGKLPEDIGIGTRTHAINAHLKAINELIELNGIGGVREFMNDVHTVRELEAKGFKRSDELKGTSVYGSNIFGPKLGNFYQNLNGNYNPVTMDRWFTRSINRIMGTMVDVKSETGLVDSPRNGSEREWMRAIMERTQGMFSSDGVEVTAADVQALLWYHEKAIFNTLRGKKGTTDGQAQEDYATAATALLEAQQRQPTGQVDRAEGGPPANLLEGQVDELPTPAGHMAAVDITVPGATAKIKRWFKRFYTKEGLLNEPTFEANIASTGLKNFYENELSQHTADMGRSIAKAYGKKLYTQVPAEALEDVNNYLAGKDVDLPGDLATTLDGMRAYLDRHSAGMLSAMRDLLTLEYKQLSEAQKVKFDNFLSGGEEYIPPSLQKHFYLYQTISHNMGTYLTRSYQAFEDEKWKDKALSNKDLVDRAKAFIAEQQPDLTPSQVTAEVSAILESARENGNFLNMIAKGSLLGSKDVSSLRRRKDVPDVIRELLGEYKDPRINFVRSATKMQWFIANHSFLMRVRQEGLNSWLFEKPDVVGGIAYDAELASKDSEPMNPLGGLYTSPDFKLGMKDALNKFEGSDLLRTLIAMNSAVKYGKTIGSPTTQARNFISASGFTLMNGHFNWLYAGKAMRSTMSDLFDTETKWRVYINHLVKIGVLHDNAYAGELKDAIKDFTDADIYTSGWKQKPRQFLNFIQKVYRFGDDFWKIIGFENEKAIQKRHGKAEGAAEKVASERIRNGYPTYSMVPKGIKWLRRAPLIGSFVSFPYEILRTTRNQATFIAEDIKEGNMEGAARRIVGASVAMSGAYAASIYSMYLFGISADDDEAARAQAPYWSRNSQLLYTGYDENGNMRSLDLSYMDPYTYDKLWLSALLNGDNETAREKLQDAAMEFLEPFLGPDIAAQAITEVAMNKKVNGGPVYNEKDPDGWITALNYLRKATQPGVINNVERTILALNDAKSPSGKPYSKFDESMAWIGLRFSTLDLPTSMIYKGYNFKDDRAKASRILSAVVGGQNKVTDKQLKKAVDKMLAARSKSYKDMIKLINGAKQLGMTDRQIRTSLKSAGVTNRDVGAMLVGKTPRWSMSGSFGKSAQSRAEVRARTRTEVREAQIEFSRRKRVINELLYR